VSLNDTPDSSEPYASTFELLRVVQPLKDTKELVRVSFVEAHAVIPNEEDRLPFALYAADDFDHRPLANARVFEGVGEQILHDQPQHERVATDLGQLPDLPDDLPPIGLEL
jgi:hypothetical protein